MAVFHVEKSGISNTDDNFDNELNLENSIIK